MVEKTDEKEPETVEKIEDTEEQQSEIEDSSDRQVEEKLGLKSSEAWDEILQREADTEIKRQEKTLNRIDRQIDRIYLTGTLITVLYSLLFSMNFPKLGSFSIHESFVAALWTIIVPLTLIGLLYVLYQGPLVISGYKLKRSLSSREQSDSESISKYLLEKAEEHLSGVQKRTINEKAVKIDKNQELIREKQKQVQQGYMVLVGLVILPAISVILLPFINRSLVL
ncbi:6TM ABC transporter family protein [Halorussus salinus]|uniref:hypothetical protein n=1 Tax=Halorussus salinus TaxID=1364935 RepID=UPI00109186A0|nr:hypothetical protein [Halorussus salinus]